MSDQIFRRFKPGTNEWHEYRVARRTYGWVVRTAQLRADSREAAFLEDAWLMGKGKSTRIFSRKADAQENLDSWRRRAERAGYTEEQLRVG